MLTTPYFGHITNALLEARPDSANLTTLPATQLLTDTT